MTHDTFNYHIFGNHINKFQMVQSNEFILYNHGQDKGSQKFQKLFYTEYKYFPY